MTERGGRSRVTAAQRGIWFGQALAPDNSSYFAAEVLELRGALNQDAFVLALEAVWRETPTLRARFALRGSEITQTFEARSLPLSVIDFSAHDAPESAAREWMERDRATRPDLGHGELFRMALLRLGPERHDWYICAHHILLDGYGFRLFQRRIARSFERLEQGLPPDLDPLPSVDEWVREDEQYRDSSACEKDAAFWSTYLEGAPPPTLLAPTRGLDRAARRRSAVLLNQVQAPYREVARREKLEGSVALLAAGLVWLHRESGAAEQLVGIPVTGRLGSRAARLPCMAMNILPLRSRLPAGTSFVAVARGVQQELARVRMHQRYRYEDLKRNRRLSGGERRLFGAVVNLMPFDAPHSFGSLQAEVRTLASGPVEDLSVALRPGASHLGVVLEANPLAYDDASLDALFCSLCETLTTLPERAGSAVDARPRSRAGATTPEAELSVLRGEPLETPSPELLDALVDVAQRFQDERALEQEGEAALSYAELLDRVQRLATRLAGAGVCPGDLVAILLPRSPAAIVTQLALLWLGAAYLPLDPTSPVERTRFVLRDAQPTLVVTSDRSRPELTDCETLFLDGLALASLEATRRPKEPVPPAALAYVIYTSGSTGQPQGVAVSRGALSHFVAAATQRYGIVSGDRLLQFAPLQFDASVEEIFLSLTAGATLVLRSEEMLESFSAWTETCERQQLSVLDLPTAFWHEWVDALGAGLHFPSRVRLTIIGGEAAQAERLERWRQAVPARVVLLNTYGPTEATVVCTAAELARPESSGGGEPLIGRPLPGIEAVVLDEQRRVVRRGMAGELCILGPTLARGYLGRPEATERRFVQVDARAGQRGYLTGDRVSLTPTGELRYLGRLDDELKISGHRVHPLEVEAALLALAEISEAAVVVRRGEQPGLVAFVVARAGAAPQALTPSAIRAQLRERLAAVSLPAAISLVDRLPRDANGKIDRGQLRDWSKHARPDLASERRGWATTPSPLEQLVRDVWSRVLGTSVDAPDADFFELGGHSLLALRVAQSLSSETGVPLSLSVLYRAPTVAGVAAFLARELARRGESAGIEPPGKSEASASAALEPVLELASGSGPRLFCFPPADGVCWCYAGLSRHLHDVQLIGVQNPGLTGAPPRSFAHLVERAVELALAQDAAGPYRLLGWSSGGGVAHAVACALRERGREVALLALLDSYPGAAFRDTPEPTEQDALAAMLDDLDASARRPDGSLYPVEELFRRLKAPGSSLSPFDDRTLWRMCRTTLAAMQHYRAAEHPLYAGDVLFLRAARRLAQAPEPEGWRPFVQGAIELVDVPATHLSMCSPEALAVIGPELARRLTSGQSGLRTFPIETPPVETRARASSGKGPP